MKRLFEYIFGCVHEWGSWERVYDYNDYMISQQRECCNCGLMETKRTMK